jgi:hypothetical protein
MSYNKAQFQVAFKPSDLIDNLKSAQIAALGRDRTIAQLNKMSNLDNPWAKLTAYSALGRFAQQYQHEKIEALGGSGSGDLQKQYMRDVSSYLEQKTAHAKKERDITERIREADVYGVMSAVSGMENVEGEYEGGVGGGLYGVEGSGSEAEELAEMGGALAAAQARSEFGLELEHGRERFSALIGELRGSMTSEAQQGSLSAASKEQAEGGRRKKLGVERKPRAERLSAAELREELEQDVSFGRMMEFENPEAFAMLSNPDTMAELAVVERRKKIGQGRKSRSERLSGASTAPMSRASFELVEEGPSWSLLDEPSSGGGAAFDPTAIVYDFIAQNPPPERALTSQKEAWEEYLQRIVGRGGKPITFKKFKDEFYSSLL